MNGEGNDDRGEKCQIGRMKRRAVEGGVGEGWIRVVNNDDRV